MTENKRFTVYGKEIVQDDECWAVAYSEYNADVIATALNELAEENKLHKERISLLLSLLDLADAIIDTCDNEKAKQVWDSKNEQTEKEWERILNDRE